MEKVSVPVDLLLDSSIAASAKVVWMVLRLRELTEQGRPSPTRLAALTGLSRPTVRKGLARLAAAGWYHLSPPRAVLPKTQPGTRRFVTIPGELLEDRSIRPQAVVMYGVLQATPGFRPPTGQYTRKQLREITGRALKTIRRATNMLAACGWIEFSRKNHLCPFVFTVKNPVYEACKAELEGVVKRINRADYIGEEIMRQFLTAIVDSDNYQDNASPGFLVNPFTRERMELDRYYHGGVAFEFNGPQHYEPTEFATPQDVEKQRARDYIKAGICRDRGIPLVVIHPEDLTLETMIRKVGTYLPLRDLRKVRPIIQYLEWRSRRYRRSALRNQALAAKRAAAAGGPH